jgi:PEP-CTERM motif
VFAGGVIQYQATEMKRLFPMQLLVALAALGWSTSVSRAQHDPPDIVDRFRLIPRLSTLHTTGIEGPDARYRLIGEYDFRERFAEHREARFEHAEIWGSLISDLPTPAVVIDVDEILNLEGLKGEPLPILAPINGYQFKGETSDGSSVNLVAVLLGPWMYVRGGTMPPPNTADFPTHRVQWLARSRPFADVSGNGVVDAADFVMIRDAETSVVAIGSEFDGTAGVTYADWLQQFGETIPDVTAIDAAIGSAMASAAAATVPEPGSISLAFLGGVLIAGLGRRRATAIARRPPISGPATYRARQ